MGEISQEGIDSSPKRRLTAGLLGIALGWLGVHRFYLGYRNVAFAQLACGVIGLSIAQFTCGSVLIGAVIWGIVDGVMILTGSISTDGHGRPLRD